jgi:hypothetical protein
MACLRSSVTGIPQCGFAMEVQERSLLQFRARLAADEHVLKKIVRDLERQKEDGQRIAGRKTAH